MSDKALKAWEMAVHYRPTHTAAWSNTLVLLDSLNQFDEVLKRGKHALMHNPKAPALHFSIANTLGKLQEFEKAEKHFLEALNFNPHNALYYSNLGKMLTVDRWDYLLIFRFVFNQACCIIVGEMLIKPVKCTKKHFSLIRICARLRTICVDCSTPPVNE